MTKHTVAKLPKGAVLSKDKTRYALKGRSYPYLTGQEKSTVNLTQNQLENANQFNKLFGMI